MKGSFEIDNYQHRGSELFIRGHIEPKPKESVFSKSNSLFNLTLGIVVGKVLIDTLFGTFDNRTRKVMFWEQFTDSDKDFYCGG